MQISQRIERVADGWVWQIGQYCPGLFLVAHADLALAVEVMGQFVDLIGGYYGRPRLVQRERWLIIGDRRWSRRLRNPGGEDSEYGWIPVAHPVGGQATMASRPPFIALDSADPVLIEAGSASSRYDLVGELGSTLAIASYLQVWQPVLAFGLNLRLNGGGLQRLCSRWSSWSAKNAMCSIVVAPRMGWIGLLCSPRAIASPIGLK